MGWGLGGERISWVLKVRPLPDIIREIEASSTGRCQKQHPHAKYIRATYLGLGEFDAPPGLAKDPQRRLVTVLLHDHAHSSPLDKSTHVGCLTFDKL